MPAELDDVRLTLDQLIDVRDQLSAQIREGLAEDGHVVKALPAYLPPPATDLEGEALVIDTGGTNMRAAVVRLVPGGAAELLAGPLQVTLPVRGEDRVANAAQFFAMQAQLAAQLQPKPGLPVGYCFSYPSEVLPSRDARLIRWTKGIDVPGVEGALVGAGLGEALTDAGYAHAGVTVLNDTVAALLAGARSFEGRSRDVAGLIAGTGTNMAGFFDGGQAAKLDGDATMAINLESGNVHPPHLCAADDAVDAASTNVGAQRFEKAVSGYYLPFIFAALRPQAGLDPDAGTAPLVRMQDNGQDGPNRETARALLARSADLIAAGLAATLDTYPEDAVRVGIQVEGSLYWRATGYANRVQGTLRKLMTQPRQVEILHAEEANLVGAAVAALT